MLRLGFLIALVALASPGDADACSYAFPENFEPGYDPPRADDSPPAPPEIVSIVVKRNPLGCGESAGGGDCSGNGIIELRIQPGEDDLTLPQQMGFRVEDADGNPINVPFRLDDFGETFIIFSDEGGDVHQTYTLVQIDLGNNESEPVTFEVVDEEGGCSAGGSATSWWLIAGATLLAVIPRRRAGRSRRGRRRG